MTPQEKFEAITNASPLGPMLTSTAKEWAEHAETCEALIQDLEKIRGLIEDVRTKIDGLKRVADRASSTHLGAAASFALAQWCPQLVGKADTASVGNEAP